MLGSLAGVPCAANGLGQLTVEDGARLVLRRNRNSSTVKGGLKATLDCREKAVYRARCRVYTEEERGAWRLGKLAGHKSAEATVGPGRKRPA